MSASSFGCVSPLDPCLFPFSNDNSWFQNVPLEELVNKVFARKTSVFTLMNQNDFSVYGCSFKLNESLLFCMENRIVIVVDMRSRQFVRVNDIDLSRVKHDEIVDLSVDGDRWEGDVLNEKPFGWGTLYDKDNNLLYEGFRIDDVNVCYGRSYYSDIGKMEYEGGICEGARWGKGTQYDRNGAVVYKGQWLDGDHFDAKNDKRVVITPSTCFFHNCVRELVVSDGCCNDDSWHTLDFHLMSFLRSLTIGSDCFMNVNDVRLSGLQELVSVEIGDRCFTRGKGAFRLTACPFIQELKIGSSSFSFFSSCIVETNPSLFVLSFASFSFAVASLTLRELTRIMSIWVEAGCFVRSLHNVIESRRVRCE